MKRISIRIRFSLMIGLMICLFSFITMTFSVNNIKSSLMEYENSVNDSASIAETIINEKPSGEPPLMAMMDTNKEGLEGVSPDTKSKILMNNYQQAISLIEESQERIIGREILFSILMGVLGILVAYPVSVWLLKPFRNFASDIEAINVNNLSVPVRIENEDDELGKIKKSFNVMLERLNRSFDRQKRFSSNAAHELKTPLAVMKTYIEILDENSDIDEYKETVAVVDKNVNRMVNLVNDFMEYAKDEPIRYEKMNVSMVIGEALNELESLIRKRNITMHINVKNVEIMSNASLYKQLVYNLLSNAVNYNKDNGHIFIDADERELVVRDTGIGIEEDKLGKIFEPLYCVDKSRSREVGGSGLGLSIVQNICNLLNYRIEVSSKPGFGTEFIIKL